MVAVIVCGTNSAQAKEITTGTTVSDLQSLAFAACQTGLGETTALLAKYGTALTVENIGSPNSAFRRSFTLQKSQTRLFVDLTAFAGQVRRLRSFSETLHDAKKQPQWLIDLTPDCQILHGRRIFYDAEGSAVQLIHLDNQLHPTGLTEPLNPPVPSGTNAKGVAVAHIDSGVNYLLDVISNRLARDPTGKLLGYDFWDNDNRPFDADTSRSPFFPLHHGTAVSSLLLSEAPTASLMPFRYPRPDMSRMGPLIEQAATQGARIVMMPLGSNSSAEWQAFHAVTARHPDILFIVSAGNDGRDIDQAPLYPSAFDLPNMLVVTSSDDFGRLATGSNWGVESVDLMAPGEKVEVIDHRGAKGVASGSSFVVPRIAALAARLLDTNPGWTTQDLLAAIQKRAVRPLDRGPIKVKWGWIPNPAEGG